MRFTRCEGLTPTMGSNAAFASMYDSFEKISKLSEAHRVLKEALDVDTSNNFQEQLCNQGQIPKSFDAAENILLEILRSDPDYDDAKANLNRVRFQKSLIASESDSKDSGKRSADEVSNDLVDPLAAAFTEAEVEFSKKQMLAKNPAIRSQNRFQN